MKKSLAVYLNERRGNEAIPLHPKFPFFKSRSRKGNGFSPNTMQMLFKRMYLWMGLNQASSRSGRRAFATSLIDKGIDIKEVSSLMGHYSVAMTAKYVDETLFD